MTIEGFEQTGEDTESSPGLETESSEQAAGESKQLADKTQETSADQLPFHEHPRFKELIEQKNQYARDSQEARRQLQEMNSRIAQMEQTRTQAQKREDALHSRLKGIDPEFGERFEKLDSTRETVEQLQERLRDFELAQVRQQGISMVNSLHTQNKVSGEMQELYNSQIENFIRSNPNVGLNDLPQVYKQVHEKMSKIFDTMKRTERESYVTDKKKDASIPSSPKGKASTPAGKASEWSKDPYEARQQLVNRVRAQLRTERES